MIDLYTVDDPQKYTNVLEARIEQPEISEPFIEYNGRTGGNIMLGLNNDDDDDEYEDDSSEDGRKSI